MRTHSSLMAMVDEDEGSSDQPDNDYGVITDFEFGVDTFRLEGLTFEGPQPSARGQ